MTIYTVYLNETTRYPDSGDRLVGYGRTYNEAASLMYRAIKLYSWASPEEFRVEPLQDNTLV